MKRTPHCDQATGYFGRLDVDMLERQIREVIESPSNFFCLTKDERGESHIFRSFRVATDEEVIEFDHSEVADFFAELRGGRWDEADIHFGHGRMTGNMRLVLPPTHLDEYINITINEYEGLFELECRLQSVKFSREFVDRLNDALKLSTRPIKHSRHITPALETKLLCDAMHVCSVCGEEGVQIHHIKPVEEGGLTLEENLIVLCLKHHRMAHTKYKMAKKLTEEHLHEYKNRHLKWVEKRGPGRPAEDFEPD